MELNELKIAREDVNRLNVKSADDTYNSTNVQDNKNIFDRLPEHIVEKFNQLIDELVGLMDGMYTREQVDSAINQKVVDMTAGDMAKGVYDTNNNNVVDKAEKLAIHVKIGNVYFDGSKGITLTEMGAATVEQGVAIDSLTTDIKFIKVVDSLPTEPDVHTLYLIPKK